MLGGDPDDEAALRHAEALGRRRVAGAAWGRPRRGPAPSAGPSGSRPVAAGQRLVADELVPVRVDRAGVAHAELLHDPDRLRVRRGRRARRPAQAERAERGGKAGTGGLGRVPPAPGRPLELVDELDVGAGAVDVDDPADADHLAGVAQLDRPQAEAVRSAGPRSSARRRPRSAPRPRLAVGADVAHRPRGRRRRGAAPSTSDSSSSRIRAAPSRSGGRSGALRRPGLAEWGTGTAEQCRAEGAADDRAPDGDTGGRAVRGRDRRGHRLPPGVHRGAVVGPPARGASRPTCSTRGCLLDCAQMCDAARDMMLRSSDFAHQVAALTADVCERCAASCERTGEGMAACAAGVPGLRRSLPRARIGGPSGPSRMIQYPVTGHHSGRGEREQAGQVRVRDRGRRLVAGQGDHRGVARAAAEGAGPPGLAAEVRPLHQRRPRDDEPVPARRGVRDRGRRRDRPRPRATTSASSTSSCRATRTTRPARSTTRSSAASARASTSARPCR